jgi:tRNA-splicing ligase RtcB
MKLEKLDDQRWQIVREGGMRVPGIVYASAAMMHDLRDDPALGQVANVAHLPGIVRASLAMPDIHWATAFPSAASRPSTKTRASSARAASATTSTAACGS